MKKLIFGLLVAAAAIGTSAFTGAQQTYEFYRVSGSTSSTDPQDYEYQPTFACQLPSTNNCSVSETLDEEPALGSNPSPSAMSNIQKGIVIQP